MYHVSRNGSQEGPFDHATVKQMLASGALKYDDHIWKDGWPDWKPISSEFASSGRPSVISPAPTPPTTPTAPGKDGPLFSMKGVSELLEVYPDKVAITPKGLLGAMAKGLKGTKFIPFYSVTAIQFRKAGMLSGYLQFTIPGGNESRGGVFAAASDENTFMFGGSSNNERAQEIKDFIDRAITKLRAQPTPTAAVSLSDEISKLAALHAQGLLSDEEFTAAKKSLISG